MKHPKYPKNKEYFKKLIPFTQKIISLCRDSGIDPVIYGSFAHFIHTKDKSMNVNDIDLLIPKKDFPKAKRFLEKENIKHEYSPHWDTIIVKKGKLKVELDAVGTGYKFLKEESLSKKVFKKVDFYGTAMRIITLKQLEDIYSVAYNRSKDDKEKIMERIKRLEKSMGRKMKWSQVQNDKKLHDYYNKHVANKKFYRVFSSEYKKDIKVHGLTSKRNPYKKKYNDIKKLFKILLWLEKTQNFNHTQNWGKIVTAEKIVRTSLNDMKKKYIDFTPHLHEVKYYKKLINKKGGALVSATKLISDDILKRKPKLPSWANYTFINSMKKWAQQKGKHPFMVLYVKGSSKSFEKATYQIALGKGPKVPSPLGSFEHFKKVVNKYGLKKFKATLEADPRKEVTKKTHLNVRVTKSVSKEDIHIV